MAKVKELEIKTGPAIKSVTDLRNNITALKKLINGWTEDVEVDGQKVTKTFQGLEIGTQKYREALSQLQENQAALRNAMYGTAASMKDITDAATAANVQFNEQGQVINAQKVSYNELVRTLAILKQEWRSTYDEQTRADLTKKINSVNTSLKDLDAKVGVFGRNVGNYMGAVDHLVKGIGVMGKDAAAAVQPIQNMNSALTAVSTNPVVAILGVLAVVLKKVIDAMKSSEENTRALSAALAPLQAIGDIFNKTLEQMGKALIKVVEWMGKLTGKVLDNNEAVQRRVDLAKQEKDLIDAQRQATMDNADAEKEIARLRAQAADKSTYTAKERIAFLEQAGELEKEIAKRNKENAEAEYEFIKLRNSTPMTTTEQLNEEAAAYANLQRAETDAFNKERSIMRELSRARKEAASEAAAAAKAVRDARQKEAEDFAAFLEPIDADIQAEENDLLDEVLAGFEKAENDAKEKTQGILEAVADGVQKRQAWNEVLTEDERDAAANRYQIQMDGLFRQLDILEQARDAALDEGYLDSFFEYETRIAEIKENIELESARRSRALREQDVKDAKDKAKQKQVILQTSAGAVADIFNSLADIYEADSEQNKKAAEKAKSLRIATTIIDTLAGAISAFRSGVDSGIPAPYNMILAAAQASAVTIAGMANVAKIKSTNISTGGGGGGDASATIPAAVSAPSIQPEVNQVRTITGASEEERLNAMAQPQRVYILSSDLEADRKATQVQIEETTF